MSVQTDGLEQFVAEVRRRGGTAVPRDGREALIDIAGADGRRYCVKLKTKQRGDWQAQKTDGSPRRIPIDAWVFIDVHQPVSSAPVVDAEWMRKDIQGQVDDWLAADPSRDVRTKNHHKIEEFRVAGWAGRWDLIGLADGPTGGRVTDDNLGAWVFKCNPKVWKIEEFIADGNNWIDSWSVFDNYRSEMIANGQRAILWVSGSETGKTPRGIWGLGWTAGVRYPVVDTEDGYWATTEGRAAVDWFVPTDIHLLDEPVSAADVLAHNPHLRDMEVFRSPQMANPSWISKSELRLLERLLPEWPDQDPGVGETITIGPGGAGQGDAATNTLVEEAAIATVIAHFESLGYRVDDVGNQKVGWDLTCSSRLNGLRRVEVKGVAGRQPSILLTRNELRSAREDKYWELAIVTSALTEPTIAIFTAQDVTQRADGYVYQVDMRGVDSAG
ncbi:protein NO VEIN domain-containing protein [Gordonia terrae]|uniref:protein NO VEIN domain-containing protein n=1 Tax=Gordonia terrae TaxID=2055 RepID=UPI0015DFDC33|nr:DUF3883 domain-containing protein [Gordonia terrae]